MNESVLSIVTNAYFLPIVIHVQIVCMSKIVSNATIVFDVYDCREKHIEYLISLQAKKNMIIENA